MAYFKTQPDTSFHEELDDYNGDYHPSPEPEQDFNFIKKPTKVTNTIKKKPIKLQPIKKPPIYTKKYNNNTKINDEIAKAKANPNRKPVKLFDEFESKSANFNDYNSLF
jgi:hypothetical protein